VGARHRLRPIPSRRTTNNQHRMLELALTPANPLLAEGVVTPTACVLRVNWPTLKPKRLL